MSATQARAQTASTNIANESTPGYVRRQTGLESINFGGGVGAVGINRVQDAVLVANRRDAQGQAARSELVDASLTRSLSAFGQPGQGGGVFGAFDQFSGDLQTLKASPESLASQSITVASLKDLTQAIADASGSIQNERTVADAAIAADVDLFNQLAENLFELNADIRNASANARDSNALLDQRDQMLDEMSKIIPFDVQYEDSGAVGVKTSTGLNIVGATVKAIEFSPATRVAASDTTTVLGGRLSIPTLDGRPIGPNSGIHGLSEGRLSANLDIRDSVMTEQATALDQFAFDLASSFDALGEPILQDAGAPIDPLNIVGLSERLTVNAALDPAQGGTVSRIRDGLTALTPGNVSDDTLLTQFADATSPFANRLGDMISDVSSQSFRAQRIHAGNVAREITLTEAEGSISGVDLDFELQSLLAIEQAYSANARVIQTVSDMLDTLARL
jgi:flagellar hook-associated protein 1 FlgK